MAEQDDVARKIRVINDEGVDLTQWERDFMNGITQIVAKGWQLSDKRVATVEKIHSERCKETT